MTVGSIVNKFSIFNKAFLLLLTVIYIFISGNLWAQKTKAKLQNDKQQLENDIAYANKLLSKTKKNKQISLNQLIILNNKINQREGLINTVNTEIQDIDGKIISNFKETSRLTNEIKRLKEEYAKMIYFAYKNRNAFTRLMFLFASTDINQVFIRLKYLQQYARYRRKQAERIMNASMMLNETISQLKNIKSGKSTLLKSKEAEKSLLAQEKEEKNGAVKKLQQKEKDLIKSIRQKEKEAKKLQQSIESIITEEIKKAAEKSTTSANITKKTTNISSTSKELGLTEAELVLSNSFTSNKGKLSWPTEKGIVTSTFGEHPHPVLTGIKVKNNGIDISTNSGAKARAVFDGKVTGVISIPGANKAVIIRHGEYLTVYSNLKEVYVKTGDNIKIKQSIGLVFTDDDESKTELHFEVWYGKVLTDPLGWLGK
ncbi:MAG: peptidoglycan DD-metalloendopeptidase family protein [Bacteroidales bacterium]